MGILREKGIGERVLISEFKMAFPNKEMSYLNPDMNEFKNAARAILGFRKFFETTLDGNYNNARDEMAVNIHKLFTKRRTGRFGYLRALRVVTDEAMLSDGIINLEKCNFELVPKEKRNYYRSFLSEYKVSPKNPALQRNANLPKIKNSSRLPNAPPGWENAQIFSSFLQIPPKIMILMLNNKVVETLRQFEQDLKAVSISFLALAPVPCLKKLAYSEISPEQANIIRQRVLLPLGVLAIAAIVGIGPAVIPTLLNK